jgi:5-methylcytosine-specific restriction endonuclease McrA
MKQSSKVKARNVLIKELDALARERTFERDGYKCIRCGSTSHLQWCHVITRGILSLRWDMDNSFCGCAGCHLFWHKHPLEAVGWFEDKFPERAKHLLEVRRMKITVDLKELLIGMRIGNAI